MTLLLSLVTGPQPASSLLPITSLTSWRLTAPAVASAVAAEPPSPAQFRVPSGHDADAPTSSDRSVARQRLIRHRVVTHVRSPLALWPVVPQAQPTPQRPPNHRRATAQDYSSPAHWYSPRTTTRDPGLGRSSSPSIKAPSVSSPTYCSKISICTLASPSELRRRARPDLPWRRLEAGIRGPTASGGYAAAVTVVLSPRQGGHLPSLSSLCAARSLPRSNASHRTQQQVFSLIIAAPEPIRVDFRDQKLARSSPSQQHPAAAPSCTSSWEG